MRAHLVSALWPLLLSSHCRRSFNHRRFKFSQFEAALLAALLPSLTLHSAKLAHFTHTHHTTAAESAKNTTSVRLHAFTAASRYYIQQPTHRKQHNTHNPSTSTSHTVHHTQLSSRTFLVARAAHTRRLSSQHSHSFVVTHNQGTRTQHRTRPHHVTTHRRRAHSASCRGPARHFLVSLPLCNRSTTSCRSGDVRSTKRC